MASAWHVHVVLGFDHFAPPYNSSLNEPDGCIKPDALPLPTIVAESGWFESWPRLDADKDLWLVGGIPHVQLVFLAKWTEAEAGSVKGNFEVHGRDSAGTPALLQTKVTHLKDF